MLIVVHQRNIQFFFQSILYVKTFRGFDIFQVDTTEGRGDRLDSFNEFVGISLIDLYIKHIDVCIDLEEQAFAFHDRLAGQGAYIAKA